MTRILVVEDEATLAEAMRYSIEAEGFSCSVALDGITALERFRTDPPDLVLLDLMLPGIGGVDVCRSIRATSSVPIIVVSARSAEVDKVLALELGADDYVTKPVGMRELVARVRSVLRRAASTGAGEMPDGVITVGHVELDTDRHEARVHGGRIDLPPKEFSLLESLLRRPGRLCTRDLLIAEVWGPDYFGDTRTLDVHIKRLRRKIEDDSKTPKHLITVRGLGYKFQP